MKKLFLLFILFSFSCENSQTKYVLKSKNVEGLSKESILTLNGLKIGKVHSFELARDSVFITISTKEDIKIPIDSKFTSYTSGLLGSKNISVNFGNSSGFIAQNDTLELFSSEVFLNSKKLDSISKIIGGTIEKTIKVLENDSLK